MDYQQLIVDINVSILHTLEQMDKCNRKLLLVFSEGEYFGLVSIGDIQRAIIGNKSLDTPIKNILRDRIITADDTLSLDEIRTLMMSYRMEFIPILNTERKLVKVLMWSELFPNEDNAPIDQFDLPIVIMAGGQGTRLKPLTNIIPH